MLAKTDFKKIATELEDLIRYDTLWDLAEKWKIKSEDWVQ